MCVLASVCIQALKQELQEVELRLNAKQEHVVGLENKLTQVEVREHCNFSLNGSKMCSNHQVLAAIVQIVFISEQGW